jgi:ATP-dependent Clp protease ATP-binding subunit ClpB
MIESQLKDFCKCLKLCRINLVLKDHEKDYLSGVGYLPAYGAQPLANVMCEHLLKPLAKVILQGDTTEGGSVTTCFNAESHSMFLQPSA